MCYELATRDIYILEVMDALYVISYKKLKLPNPFPQRKHAVHVPCRCWNQVKC